MFYDQEVFGYVGLGDNNAEINAIQEDGMLSISATGSQISEINLRFQALELTEGRNEENKEYIKLNNFLSGDNEGDTDIASNDMQQVGIQVIEAPVEELPIDELPATGSVVDTLIATNIAGIALLAVVLKKYVNN